MPICIATVSRSLLLGLDGHARIGLELGNRIGTKTGERGELIGGLVLIGVGAVIAAGLP